jgi:RNA polymerase sigma factor (sigma-70 family)
MTTVPPFQRTLEAHGDAVWRYLRGMVGAWAADDCFQETFIAALRAYPRLQPESNLRAWLLTIAHRKAIDHLRRQRREALEPLAGELAAEPQQDGAIWSAVAKLPPRQRASVLLRYGCELRHREIAAAIGCSEEAARRSLHEGLKRLRETL